MFVGRRSALRLIFSAVRIPVGRVDWPRHTRIIAEKAAAGVKRVLLRGAILS